MLRIFGICERDKTVSKQAQVAMEAAFIGGDKATVSYVRFTSKNIYLLFEHVRSDEAKNFFEVDKTNDRACFIVGNIHAYKDKTISCSSQSTLAHWVLEKYARERSWDFVKDLRGVFNIIVIDGGRVFLVNDLLGLSPMYVQQAGGECWFCTEVEPIAAMKHRQEADIQSITDFFVYGLVPEGKTFFKGLYNQEAGSVVILSLKPIDSRPYAKFQQADIRGLTRREKIVLLNDAFSEAVSLRAPGKKVYADLTGGLDTRFIIAHLLELKKDITAVTFHIDDEDVDCARRVAAQFSLRHYVEKTSARRPSGFVYKFQTRFGRDREAGNATADHVRKRGQLGVPLCRYPKFGGQFANGLLSQPIEEFKRALDLDHQRTAQKIFKPHVAAASIKAITGRSSFRLVDRGSRMSLSKGRAYQFAYLSQIGRSYANVHHGKFWARPTQFFEYGKLMPFVDAKFLSVLLSLEDEFFDQYKAYYEIYQSFFPGFFSLPVAGSNVHTREGRKTLTSRGRIEMMITENVDDAADFKVFLKENGLVALTPFVLSERLLELIVFYHWCRSNTAVYETLRNEMN